MPVTIAPQNVQAIITGSGTDFAQIKYIKEGIFDEFTEQSIIYSSGTGAIFKSGIPIGRLKSPVNEDVKEYNVEFYSDFSQLKYVFADVGSKTEIIKVEEKLNNSEVEDKTPLKELDYSYKHDSLLILQRRSTLLAARKELKKSTNYYTHWQKLN